MEQYDARVDVFIERSAAFAQPILKHIRALVHQTSPLIMETIKWNAPFFDYKGSVCHMNAFKEHVGLGFWNSGALFDPGGFLKRGEEKDSVGNFGRITSISDLPDDDIMMEFIRQAMAINETSPKISVVKKATPAVKQELIVPDYFEAALNAHLKAKEIFENFSYSHKKEYLTWIIDAKTDATRQKRMAQAIEMMEEGKSRHWKYQAP